MSRHRSGVTGWMSMSGDELEARVVAVVASDLRRREAVRDDDVAGEVVGAADERRADAVGVDRHVVILELADLLGGEASGYDDAHALVPAVVEGVPHLPDEPRVHTGRLEVAHLVPQ